MNNDKDMKFLEDAAKDQAELMKRVWQFLVVVSVLFLAGIAFDLIVDILNRIF